MPNWLQHLLHATKNDIAASLEGSYAGMSLTDHAAELEAV